MNKMWTLAVIFLLPALGPLLFLFIAAETTVWRVDPLIVTVVSSFIVAALAGIVCFRQLAGGSESGVRSQGTELAISAAVALGFAVLFGSQLHRIVQLAGFSFEKAQPLLMWRISKNQHSAYVLGSIHALRKDCYPLPSAIESAFHASTHLALEVDLSAEAPQITAKKMIVQGLLHRDDSLMNYLSPGTQALLSNYIQRKPTERTFLLRLSPWLAALSLETAEEDSDERAGGSYGMIPMIDESKASVDLGIDRHFADQAKAQHMPIEEIETLAMQTRVFSALPRDAQERLLVFALSQSAKSDSLAKKQSLEKICNAWKSADVSELEKLIAIPESERGHLSQLNENLWVTRNKTMVAKIQGYVGDTNKKYFVVVGAGHLVGKDGILQLLRSSGYAVEQVMEPACIVRRAKNS